MRVFLSLLVVLNSLALSAQEHERVTSGKLNEHHELVIIPASIWFNKDFFVGHAFQYRYNFNGRSSLTVETNGTIFRELDHRSKYPSDEKVMPLLNESTLIYRKLFFGKGIMKTRNKAIRWIGSIRLGYQFFQHSAVYQEDYWILDSTVSTGATYLAAFQSHSITAGLEAKREKHLRQDGRRKLIADHFLSIDYIGAVVYQTYAYDINAAGISNYQSINNTFDLNKSGYKIKYQYTRWVKPTIGINFGMAALWIPFIEYSPNDSFFIPKGGERISPLLLNANVGVIFKFNERYKF